VEQWDDRQRRKEGNTMLMSSSPPANLALLGGLIGIDMLIL